MRTMQSTRTITFMGVMAALSIILIYAIRFPIFPAAPYLEYEPGDIPIYMTAFLFGPISGLVVTVIACIIQGITVSASSGIVGVIMHIFATGAFVLVAGNIYRMKKSRTQLIIALLAGIATMTISMCLWNIIITPIYTGFPRSAVIQMLVPVIIPFNLIKAGVNSILTLVLYETVAGLIIKSR